MNGAQTHIAGTRAAVTALTLGLALLQTACIILPARFASGVSGSVVDAISGQPVADAIVVVRFEGRNGDVLPDRDVLGHREATTDEDGRFHASTMIRPGVSIWPIFRTEARVVAVIADGYRCARPVAILDDAPVRVPLHSALDIGDQRSSCRPVPANRGEAEDYMAAWRDLFPTQNQASDSESRRQLARVLEARSVLGFGQNCEGPVTDLALAPEGLRAAYTEGRERSTVNLVTLAPGTPATPEFVVEEERSPQRRLAWTSAGDLAMWTSSDDSQRTYSASVLGPNQIDILWKARQRRSAPPASPDPAAGISGRPQHALLEPADLSDEGDTRWLGRTFLLEHALDTETGLASDSLVIVHEDGNRHQVELPGETCGPTGRFGRPHYRVTATGNSGIDLRFVDGGCHAIEIDFASGAWRKLDASGDAALCQKTGNLPATHLETALRGYSRDVQAARISAGGDIAAAFALTIAPDGATRVETRNLEGEIVTADVPDFPLTTPLRRIQVSIVGAAGFKGTPADLKRGLEPL